MASMRVHELAKEFDMSSGDLLDRLKEMKIPAKSHASMLNDAYVDKIRKNLEPEIRARAGALEAEEAAALAAEQEEAERKLERTQENLVRITDKIDELELQVEPLRAQSEKAKKYLILRDELRGLEISLWMEQLDKIRANTIKITSDFENAARQKEEAQHEVESLYAAAEGYAAQMREKDMEAEGLRFQMQQREADANECERAIAVLKSQIQSNLENADRVKRELEAQEGRAGSISAQIADRRARLDEISARMVELKAGLEESEAQSRTESKSAGILQAELEALREKAAVESASAAEAKALLSALAAAAQELLEYAEYVNNYYGTSLKVIREKLAAGIDVLLDIEVQGAAKVKDQCPDALSIFIIPPSFEELSRRLHGRNTDSEEVISGRLEKARIEFREIPNYDYLVINDKVSNAVYEIESILTAAQCRVENRSGMLSQFI